MLSTPCILLSAHPAPTLVMPAIPFSQVENLCPGGKGWWAGLSPYSL
jgi:hypothetical protein